MRVILQDVFVLIILFLANTESMNIRNKASKTELFSLLKDYQHIRVENEHFTPKPEKNHTKLFAYYNKKSHTIELKDDELRNQRFIAKASFNVSRYTVGWDQLKIKTTEEANPMIQCWTTGYLEGLLTYQEIHYNYENSKRMFLNDPGVFDKLRNFYKDLHQMLGKNIEPNKFETFNQYDLKKYVLVACFKAQLEGITQGYNTRASSKLSVEDFYYMNTQGNFGDLKKLIKMNDGTHTKNENFFTKESFQREYKTTDLEKVWENILQHGHCSAIIKLLNNNGKLDLLVGHATWTDYAELLRMMKIYDYAFDKNPYPGLSRTKISFSSYPASIYSGDDFYVTSNKLVITQSTLSTIDETIYINAIKMEEYVPDFIRIMVTSVLAKSSIEWYEIYKSFHSHLYSTQWVVVDYNIFQKAQKENKLPDEGLVVVVEELPKNMVATDLTKLLTQFSYFGSFNLPYLKQSLEVSGIKVLNVFSESYNPRYKILNHFQSSIRTLKDFEKLMQYNGYKHKSNDYPDDPSFNNPMQGISARGDIISIFSGGIDYKIVNNKMVNKMEILTKSGPTFGDNPNLKPFALNKESSKDMLGFRNGMPDIFNFTSFEFK